MPQTVGKGAISIAFVRSSSVRPSVVYVAYNSRTQRPCVPNMEGRFPTLDATHIPVSRSNGQRSGLEAIGDIPYRQNPAATLLVLFVIICSSVSILAVLTTTCSTWHSDLSLVYKCPKLFKTNLCH